jgi:hypothetical protein
MKLSPIDLGPVAVDLGAMEGSNTGEPEGSHNAVSGYATTGIEGAIHGSSRDGKETRGVYVLRDKKTRQTMEKPVDEKKSTERSCGGKRNTFLLFK